MRADPVYLALTRPVMVAGVPAEYFGMNFVGTSLAFVMTGSFLALLPALIGHGVGAFGAQRDPHFMQIFLARGQLCAPTPDRKHHGGVNSYAPW